MTVPIIDFSNPIYVLVGLIVFLLCLWLAKENKKDTVSCIMLLTFLTLLVVHTVEFLAIKDLDSIITLTKTIAVDEIFVFASFLDYLWMDHMQTQESKKKKESKKGKDEKAKVIEKDGLDVLWKKV